MADMLKFRKGTYAQIQAADKVAGTIYIAKDEKAMYVDVSASERIRIGDFIRVDTVKDITPPYSESALYYVEADNALLKYTGAEGGWKQVNGTDDIKSSLTALTNRVSTAEGKIATAEGKIAALETASTTHGTDIEALKTAIGMNEDGEVEGLAGEVADLKEGLGALEGEVDTISGKVSANETAIKANAAAAKKAQEDLAEHVTTADATYAKKGDSYLKSETYTKAEVDAAIDADVLVETNRAKAAEEANASAAAAALKAAQDAQSTADGKIDEAGVKALGYVTKVDAEAYTDGKITAEVTRADEKYATKTALEAVEAKAIKNAGDITAINTNITNNIATKSELASGVSEAKSHADSVAATAKSEAIADAATKYATTGALATTNEAVAAAQAKADSAFTLAGEKTTTAEVKAQIEAYGYATTTQVATAKSEAIAKAKEDGDKAYAAKSIEQTVAGHTASLNTLTGTGAGSVAEAKAAADAAQADIDAWEEAHANDYTNTQLDTKIADAKKAGTDAASAASANTQLINGHETRIKSLEDNSATKTELANAKTDLEKKIADEINAANAMEYIGGIGSQTELNAVVSAKEGDTYVVTSKFGAYHPGDLLIATGEEGEDGLLTSITWTHVKTGYDASLEQKIETVDGKIQLSSIAGVNNGQIEFVAADSSASVSVANNKVTIGMVWEDF